LVQEVDVYDNYLTGAIPAGWSAMRKLKTADLRYNANLTGCAPSTWDGMVNLPDAGGYDGFSLKEGTKVKGFCTSD
jgi:hypothetical protein